MRHTSPPTLPPPKKHDVRPTPERQCLISGTAVATARTSKPGRHLTPPTPPQPKRTDTKPTPLIPRPTVSNAIAQEREAQKEFERNKKKQQRASETPQQREARLQKMREYNARRTSTFKLNATIQEHEAKKEYERNKKKQQRANETPQQREARLEKMRDYNARTYLTDNFTEKYKKKGTFSYTKEYNRNQKMIQRERETAQQREERLQKARE